MSKKNKTFTIPRVRVLLFRLGRIFRNARIPSGFLLSDSGDTIHDFSKCLSQRKTMNRAKESTSHAQKTAMTNNKNQQKGFYTMKKNNASKLALIIGLPIALFASHIYFSRLSDTDIKLSEATKTRWVKEMAPDVTDSTETEKALKALEKQLSESAQNYQTQIQSEESQFKQTLRTILDSGETTACAGIKPTIGFFTQTRNVVPPGKRPRIQRGRSRSDH